MKHLPTKIIFGLALITDLFLEYADLFSRHNYFLYGYPKNGTRVRKALESLTEVGDIEKKVVNGQTQYRVSTNGWNKLAYHIPFFRFKLLPWDSKWRIIIYDIPEKKKRDRASLRAKLKKLGFGQWQKSVWVIPHPIMKELKSYVQSQNLEDFVQLYEGISFLGNGKELARKIWNLDTLESKYREFLNYFDKENGRDAKKEIIKKYSQLLMEDPGLPKDLLPTDWIGFKVQEFVSQLLKT